VKLGEHGPEIGFGLLIASGTPAPHGAMRYGIDRLGLTAEVPR